MRLVFVGILAWVCTAWAAPTSHEPANIFPLKQELHAYVDSGQYDRDMAAVASEASAWLEQRAKQGGGKLMVVFDLDETLLSNWPQIVGQDFGYIPAAWNAWVDEGKCLAIGPVREVYRQARRLGMDVVLMSGRRERDRAGTERNLREIGCADYTALFFKPDDSKELTGAFKLGHRRRLQAEGYLIVANIGDQESDFEGGVGERMFKLPNPFYITK